jgi:hypothetical protein
LTADRIEPRIVPLVAGASVKTLSSQLRRAPVHSRRLLSLTTRPLLALRIVGRTFFGGRGGRSWPWRRRRRTRR